MPLHPQLRAPGRRVGRRGAALLCWAWVDVMYGVGLVAADAATRASPTLAWVGAIMPLRWWGAVWLIVAATLVVTAVTRMHTLGHTAAAGIKILWAVLMAGGWLAGEVPRGYVSVGIWGGAAALVLITAGWSEPTSRRR